MSWRRYSFDMSTGTWSDAPLSSVWTGINAPPSTGILAATHLDFFDKLLVIADDGKFYVQEGSVWRTPVKMSVRFPDILSPSSVGSLSHVPGGWNENPPPQPLVEEIAFLDNPNVYYYNYDTNNTGDYKGHILIAKDEPYPGPLK